MRGIDGAQPEFDEAFDRLFNLAFAVGQRILTDPHDAQDVAAETAARALTRWRTISELPHRDAWICRVATNLAIDEVRKRRPRAQLDSDAISAPETLRGEALAELLSPLPRRQREVLALRYVVDLPDDEIGRALGISEGSVKKHAARGLAALRARLSAPLEVSVAY